MQDAYYEEYKTKAKSIQHVLWTCPKAKEAWKCSKMVVSVRSSRCQNFQDLMWLMMMEDQLEVDKIARVVTIAWAQWHNRNEVRLGGARKSGTAIVNWAAQYIEEHSSGQGKQCTSHME